MGYAWGGDCHQDGATALSAFGVSMTNGNPTGITSFTTAPSINGSGLITWSISHRPLTGTTATTRTGTTQLLTCTDGIDQWDISSVAWVAALFFAAMLGFRSGFRP